MQILLIVALTTGLRNSAHFNNDPFVLDMSNEIIQKSYLKLFTVGTSQHIKKKLFNSEA